MSSSFTSYIIFLCYRYLVVVHIHKLVKRNSSELTGNNINPLLNTYLFSCSMKKAIIFWLNRGWHWKINILWISKKKKIYPRFRKKKTSSTFQSQWISVVFGFFFSRKKSSTGYLVVQHPSACCKGDPVKDHGARMDSFTKYGIFSKSFTFRLSLVAFPAIFFVRSAIPPDWSCFILYHPLCYLMSNFV